MRRPASEQANAEAPSLGILDMQAAPLPADTYTISNRWQGMSPNRDRLTQVFAGASTTDSGQGLVVVMVVDWPPGSGGETTAVFDTPGRHGAVVVDSVRGRVLHLVAEDGTRYSFDLNRRAWESK